MNGDAQYKALTIMDSGLSDGTSIGVAAINSNGNITGANSADYSKYFFSDDSRYHIENTGSGDSQIVKLVLGTAYTVTFNANGHGAAPNKITNVTSGSKISAPAAPTAEGYTFGGWTYDSVTTPQASASIAAGTTGDKTYTANWMSAPDDYTAEPVIVDGTKHNIGTKTITNTTTTVTVDSAGLQRQLESASDSVVVPITSGTDTAVARLVVKNIEDMAKKDMTLSVDVGDVQYNIPSKAVQTDEVMRSLGATDPTKVPVNVTITQLTSDA